MIFGDFVRFVVMTMLFSKQNAGPGVPSTPFPSQKPSDLPPWPTGWCPDLPLPPEVVARGWELVPTLWAKGEGTRTVEMTGGRWITYVATMVNGQKAIAAYRTTDCEPVASPPGGLSPGVLQEQQADAAGKAILGAAIAMNEALKLRGYKKSDMVHYQDFQAKAGLKVDGYPGTITMLKLETVLKQNGLSLAPVKIYPWKAGGAYDGVNAPTAAEWEGVQVPAQSPISPAAQQSADRIAAARRAAAAAASKPPPVVAPAPQASSPPPFAPFPPPALPYPPIPPPIVPISTVPMSTAWTVTSNEDVQRALNLTGYGPLAEDGIVGPQTKAATLAYQLEHPPLAKNGIPGPETKAALTASVARGEHRPAVPGPVVIPAAAAPTAGPAIVSDVQVQHALNLLGYKGQDGKVLKEDGNIGPNSKYAILAFQKEHPPLAQDKIAGPQTKAALSLALARLSQAA